MRMIDGSGLDVLEVGREWNAGSGDPLIWVEDLGYRIVLFTGTMRIQEGKRRERKRSGVCMHMIYISKL